MKLKLKAKPKVFSSSEKENKLFNLWRDGITKSALEKFHACPEKFRLSYIEALRGDTDSASLRFGNLIHNALERMYLNTKHEVAGKSIDQILVSLKEREIKELTGIDKAKKLQMIEENYAQATPILECYLNYWADDWIGLENGKAGKNWIDLEKEFCIPAKNVMLGPNSMRVDIRGKIDGVYRNNSNNLWIFETKTKSRIEGENIQLLLGNDLQINLYAWAAKALYKERVHGVQYNIVRKPQIRQTQKESSQEFIARLNADIKSRPEFYFMRFEFPFSEKELSTWEHEFNIMLEEFVHWYSDINSNNYKRTSSCETRYGCCEFLSLCSSNNKYGYIKRTELFPELKGVADI